MTERPHPERLDVLEGRALYGGNAHRYAAGRPPYPSRVFDLLRDRCGLRPGCRAVDIGAGTGTVTAQLVAMGAEVTAVEPDPDMRQELLARVPGTGRVVGAPFEDAHLPEAFDLAVAATSAHWIEGGLRNGKLCRVLRPGGSLAVWWMLFDDTCGDDAFGRAMGAVFGEVTGTVPPASDPFHLDETARRDDLAVNGFLDVTSEVVPSTFVLSARQVRRLYATLAVVLRHPQHVQARLLEVIEGLVTDEFGGRVRRSYPTAVYTARAPDT